MLGVDEQQVEEDYLHALERVYNSGTFSREEAGMS